MKKTITHETIFVDFKAKKVLKVLTKKIQMAVVEYDFSNFNPVPCGTNFECFSDQERMEYSDHILQYLHEASLEDVVYWVNMGMVDKKKLEKALKLNRPPKSQQTSS